MIVLIDAEQARITNFISSASLDEQAFRRIPDVGTAADMINDDLPTNPYYLDEDFGSAAGLRELQDDDLDDFDVNEYSCATPVAGKVNVVSNIGGETIRIIKPIRAIEHHYDTIPPENTGDMARYVFFSSISLYPL